MEGQWYFRLDVQLLLVCLGTVGAVVWLFGSRLVGSRVKSGAKGAKSSRDPKDFKGGSNEEIEWKVEPVDPSFEWKNEQPRVYRPFKAGKYNITMGIQRLDPNDWLLIEETYHKATEERKRVLNAYDDDTVLHHPSADDALRELYDKMVDFGIKRYPQYFHLKQQDGMVYNSIKDSSIPLRSDAFSDTKQMIRELSGHFEEDYMVLLKDEDDGQYYLRGGSWGFPSGFHPSAKLNRPLKDIHGPVPFYKEKLQMSMDRYFSRMKSGQLILRLNWTIQAHTALYAPSENHVHTPVDPTNKSQSLRYEDLDFDKVYLRCERQTLTRLPKSQAIVFTIRTYLTPLSQIRREGRAQTLAEAVRNLPDIVRNYKSGSSWGDAVLRYLELDLDPNINHS
uniref:ARAD1D15642p n=1 Tax=Blastobotrys adeninivorans TaxID=409370 RepID=A0A060TEJ8_BLAAD